MKGRALNNERVQLGRTAQQGQLLPLVDKECKPMHEGISAGSTKTTTQNRTLENRRTSGEPLFAVQYFREFLCNRTEAEMREDKKDYAHTQRVKRVTQVMITNLQQSIRERALDQWIRGCQ